MTSSDNVPLAQTTGRWVERWLSRPRLAAYLSAAGGDSQLALDLYEWNTQVSTALLHDLAHLEVGLRNAYDWALSTRWPGPPHWTTANLPAFAPLFRTRRGRRTDINAKTRQSLNAALRAAGGPAAGPGKVIAELPFGFWRFLSSAANEKTLWVPALYRAFAAGTDRRDVDRRIGRLHGLRNRAAHHEPLLRHDLTSAVRDAIRVADLLDPHLGRYLTTTSRIENLLAQRPC